MPEVRLGGGPLPGAVLFDLDGTFADTAPDMAHALDLLLALHGRPSLPFATVRPHVSHGAKALVRLGFGLDAGDPGFDERRREYLDIYADNLARQTAPFPGIPDLIEALEASSVPWGIVTNKPAWLTDPLMAAMGLAERAACVVSGDTLPRAKPHPDPLLHACRRIGRDPAQCWYVGDAERDVAAGLAAGMGTLVALFGYLGDEDPRTWGAHGLIAEPLEVLDWLGLDVR
jgi:phosphoglycolate phosphatase